MTAPGLDPQGSHALYRFFSDDGSLLYIGATANPFVRMEHHHYDKPWWKEVCTVTIERYSDRGATLVAERRAIKAERPRYNADHNRKTAQPEAPDADLIYELLHLPPEEKTQVVLDTLYWETSASLTSIARAFKITTAEVNARITKKEEPSVCRGDGCVNPVVLVRHTRGSSFRHPPLCGSCEELAQQRWAEIQAELDAMPEPEPRPEPDPRFVFTAQQCGFPTLAPGGPCLMKQPCPRHKGKAWVRDRDRRVLAEARKAPASAYAEIAGRYGLTAWGVRQIVSNSFREPAGDESVPPDWADHPTIEEARAALVRSSQ